MNDYMIFRSCTSCRNGHLCWPGRLHCPRLSKALEQLYDDGTACGVWLWGVDHAYSMHTLSLSVCVSHSPSHLTLSLSEAPVLPPIPMPVGRTPFAVGTNPSSFLNPHAGIGNRFWSLSKVLVHAPCIKHSMACSRGGTRKPAAQRRARRHFGHGIHQWREATTSACLTNHTIYRKSKDQESHSSQNPSHRAVMVTKLRRPPRPPCLFLFYAVSYGLFFFCCLVMPFLVPYDAQVQVLTLYHVLLCLLHSILGYITVIQHFSLGSNIVSCHPPFDHLHSALPHSSAWSDLGPPKSNLYFDPRHVNFASCYPCV